MLTSSNAKYLSKEYAEGREKYARDKRNATDWEIAYYEITDTLGTPDCRDEAFLIDSAPIDANTKSKQDVFDIRSDEVL